MAKKLMSRKMKKTLAIIALVFIAIFTVAYIATLIDSRLLNGSIGYVALFFGVFGAALFIVIRLSKTPEEIKEMEERLSKGDAAKEPSGADAKADANTSAQDAQIVKPMIDTAQAQEPSFNKEEQLEGSGEKFDKPKK